MDRIGVEYISVFGISPPDLISIAADADCHHVSMILSRADYNPNNYPYFSLLDDKALRAETLARMRDRDVAIALVDGFAVFPDSDFTALRPMFDLLGEFGVTRINMVSMDPDRGRTLDQIGGIANLARDYDLTATIEPCPVLTIRTMAEALEVIGRIALPNVKLLIDTMHLARVGETAADLARVDPSLFGYIQISDAPAAMPSPKAYMDEAMNDRQIPGEGELPLVDIIAALPDDLIVSAEVPLRSLAQQGVPEGERVRRAIEGTRRVMAQVAARRG